MHIEQTINDLRKLLADAMAHKSDPKKLATIMQALEELMKSRLGPALSKGAALPVSADFREEIGALIQEIVKLSDNVKLREKALTDFQPTSQD